MEIEVQKPFPFEALPRVWQWIAPFRESVADDFAPKTLEEFLKLMGGKWQSQKSWSISRDGELGGLILFERLNRWVGTAHFLLKLQFQRKGIAHQAARIAAADIFANEGVGKLVFYPLEGNFAIGSLLINIGAKREGRMEGHTLCGGKPRDVLVYGLLKEAFEGNPHNAISDQQPHQ